MAPATKYGGKIVACQPGITDTAKSKLTTVCTGRTSGVARPASSNDAASYRCQCMAEPRHPNAITPKIRRTKSDFALSRIVARSGTRPTYQNSSETVAYVDTANTSQMSGLRKFGHSVIEFGYGISQYASHGRPVWKIGNMPAHATA